jgi:hypothetical protein
MSSDFRTSPEKMDGSTALLFTQLADLVYTSGSYDETMDSLCAAAPAMVSGCDHVSLMLRRQEGFATAAANDEVARAVDALERQVGDGPCLDAITDEAWQLDPDLTQASQWPALAERVLAETPVRGVAGFRLLVGAQSATEAAVVTSFISVALAAAHEHEQAQTLRAGLESNREIGKAIGLLMAGHKVGSEQAFAQLKKASQDLNLKITRVASEIVSYHDHR